MGLPSFLEDVQRARDDTVHFRRLLSDNALLDAAVQRLAEQARKQIPSYLGVLDKTIAHFDRILELATDLSMDLAEEVARLQAEFAIAKQNAGTRIDALQRRVDEQKSAMDLAKRSFRDELKKREQDHKRVIADITKHHVSELDRQKTAHQIERNGWQKQLDQYASQSAELNNKTRVKLKRLAVS
jgi:hypothetical protein